MVRVSADNFTKNQLNIVENEVSETRAREIVEKLQNNNNYQLSLAENQLTIKRFLRD
jgi:hypothetical protein